MRVVKIGFPSIILDNESTYFSYLIGYIESIDSQSTVQITKKLNGINIRISPSLPKYSGTILTGMKQFHNLFGMDLEFSKSMKTSVTINFNINLD